MGTIVARKAKSGTRYNAQVLRKKNGVILHRETDTFGSRREAEAWVKRRETELDAPGGLALARAPDPELRVAIQRFIDTSKRQLQRTQANIYETLKGDDCPLATMLCSQITSQEIVAYAETLAEARAPSTVGNYVSALGTIFKIAKPAWGVRLDRAQWEDANAVLRRMEITGYSNKRDRRPTLDELDAIMAYFHGRSIRKHNHGVAPMHRIVPYAIFATRRLDEIIRQDRDDVNLDHNEVIVRQMKDPRNKTTNDVRCELTPEAAEIIKAMKPDPDDNRVFPVNYGQVQQAWSNGMIDLGIDDLTFHDLRHEGISRLFEMGRTIPQVASVSGHKNWASLKRYAHIRQSGDKFANWKWLPIATAPQLFQIQP